MSDVDSTRTALSDKSKPEPGLHPFARVYNRRPATVYTSARRARQAFTSLYPCGEQHS
jgi:hypothetical protein